MRGLLRRVLPPCEAVADPPVEVLNAAGDVESDDVKDEYRPHHSSDASEQGTEEEPQPASADEAADGSEHCSDGSHIERDDRLDEGVEHRTNQT